MQEFPVNRSQRRANMFRRCFISSALVSGATIAFAPRTNALPEFADTADTDVLPTPADSLSLYLGFIDRLQSEILHNYFELVGCLAGEVRTRYEQLMADVIELERLAPRLRASRETSELRSATEVGRSSASNIKSMAEGGISYLGANLHLVSFSSESLNESLVEWEQQRRSLNLSPRAVELLRKILQEIRDLNKPTEGLKRTSQLLTEVHNDLTAKVKEIRVNIRFAISLLVSEDLSRGSGAPNWQIETTNLIKTAVSQLEKLDSYEPPKSVQTYFANTPKCATFRSSPDDTKPTQAVRDLLNATVKWIESGAQVSLLKRHHAREKVFATSTNGTVSLLGFGLWFAIRQILREELPEASRLRTTTCLGLIFPVLVGGFTSDQRKGQIYKLIPNLFPSGAFDLTEAKRTEAARRLADLSL